MKARRHKLNIAILFFVVSLIFAKVYRPDTIGFDTDTIGWGMVLLGLSMACGDCLISAFVKKSTTQRYK